ncbi:MULTISPECIES: RidA family protein [Novosphingobium]|uniref:Enamine deaminase RidA, house cleaning of reactive enamine intermediates, YjgF/YER057c/UK114 family n=1 Tax=Novosphingobium mathurense TaxID=428990 RepID=A0A1U6HGR1_9SPHN|nr:MULTISPECIES: RidA family protein [Novosphingobium]CDO38675.1 Endoribonuclease L-PSP [Novosphingobium sp. KN65.2]SLJ94958.1 Enamine deaminase RidA, house cleaning of reactive enamine intermediates, YjgF/YER057c/UK114 family [Novosphingobium mathurense]
MSQLVRFSSPDTVTPPYGPYSHVATVSADAELVFLSGQVGELPDGSLPESIEDQYLQTIKTIAAILEAEGLGPQNIVKLTTYVTEPIPADRLRAARHSVFGDIKPAATLLFVPRLAADGYKVEIDTIAVRAAK